MLTSQLASFLGFSSSCLLALHGSSTLSVWLSGILKRLMWKAAGGVRPASQAMEAAFPPGAPQRKSLHSCWKVPPGAALNGH